MGDSLGGLGGFSMPSMSNPLPAEGVSKAPKEVK